jgi:hypothetical protein
MQCKRVTRLSRFALETHKLHNSSPFLEGHIPALLPDLHNINSVKTLYSNSLKINFKFAFPFCPFVTVCVFLSLTSVKLYLYFLSISEVPKPAHIILVNFVKQIMSGKA